LNKKTQPQDLTCDNLFKHIIFNLDAQENNKQQILLRVGKLDR